MTKVVVPLVLGMALILLEMILPGGIAGLVGIMCVVTGIVFAFSTYGFAVGMYVLLGTLIVFAVLTAFYVRYLPSSPIAKIFAAKGQIGTVHAEKPELLGKKGVAITPLRPAGKALIEGKRVDVVSEGGFIERGAQVQVIQVEGLRVVVREVRGEEENQQNE